ncbi:ABC transporter ATP-binding protein [Glutamicibacter sp. MNS18]|uniref:ABC transporter ATP-binding protein n=1 Tax=Glutamicibacter sp. MNS18 TaxID=2989817 RepID=UPI002236B0FE|nr:ABC transporter ATP-binding protein [Glutamicibacter sp. MNS18]MCW4467211.1 ABC transporter ATP-binding protein [Glutamicibacter sp. MNS18]
MSQQTQQSPAIHNPSNTDSGLALTDVSLELGDGAQKVRVLDHVNLHVPDGEFAAIVGPSGSGKSSLLAVAGALSLPDTGSVKLRGHELTTLSSKQRARHRLQDVGFVFQSGNLIPSLTAADQLRMVNLLAKGPRNFDPMPLLEAVGMSHRAKHRPGQLSGGERQRVGIARALVTKPAVMLLDEPTAALDSARSHEVVGLLAQRARDMGIATVMVTHDHGMLDQCDVIYEMNDGTLTRK